MWSQKPPLSSCKLWLYDCDCWPKQIYWGQEAKGRQEITRPVLLCILFGIPKNHENRQPSKCDHWWKGVSNDWAKAHAAVIAASNGFGAPRTCLPATPSSSLLPGVPALWPRTTWAFSEKRMLKLEGLKSPPICCWVPVTRKQMSLWYTCWWISKQTSFSSCWQLLMHNPLNPLWYHQVSNLHVWNYGKWMSRSQGDKTNNRPSLIIGFYYWQIEHLKLLGVKNSWFLFNFFSPWHPIATQDNDMGHFRKWNTCTCECFIFWNVPSILLCKHVWNIH